MLLESLAQTSTQTETALNTVNLLISGAVTIIVAYLSVQRRNDRKEADARHEAAAAERAEVKETADAVAKATATVAKQVTPTNGYDTLGQALDGLEKRVNELGERLARGDARFDNMEEAEHRIAEQLAVVVSQAEETNQRLGEGETRFDRIEAKQAETLAQHGELRGEVRGMHETLDRVRAGFERDDPLRRRAVEEWGNDGEKNKKPKKRGPK